jgi:hypothetical protein
LLQPDAPLRADLEEVKSENNYLKRISVLK